MSALAMVGRSCPHCGCIYTCSCCLLPVHTVVLNQLPPLTRGQSQVRTASEGGGACLSYSFLCEFQDSGLELISFPLDRRGMALTGRPFPRTGLSLWLNLQEKGEHLQGSFSLLCPWEKAEGQGYLTSLRQDTGAFPCTELEKKSQ